MKQIKLFLILTLLIIVNEFIPHNIYLPKLYDVYNSLIKLITTYNLLESVSYTVLIFYFVPVAAFFLSYLIPVSKQIQYNEISSGSEFSKHFPIVFIPIILIAVGFRGYALDIVMLFLLIVIDFVIITKKYYYRFIENKYTYLNNMIGGRLKPEYLIYINKEFLKISFAYLYKRNFLKYFSIILVIDFLIPNNYTIGGICRLGYDYWSSSFLITTFLIVWLFTWGNYKTIALLSEKYIGSYFEYEFEDGFVRKNYSFKPVVGNFGSLFLYKSVEDNITIPAKYATDGLTWDKSEFKDILCRTGLDGYECHIPHPVSKGFLLKVEEARLQMLGVKEYGYATVKDEVKNKDLFQR